MQTLQETALNIINARRESGNQGKVVSTVFIIASLQYSFISILQYKDLLQLMIDASVPEEEREQSSPITGNKLSSDQIVSHSLTFFLAGYETTANTLSYTAYLLALHPDIQEKLQREIDNYLDDNPVSHLPTVRVVTVQVYLLRMSPCMMQLKRLATLIWWCKSHFECTHQLQCMLLLV